MVVDPRKRQKKLEKKRSKEKVKQKELAQRLALGLGEKIARLSAAPILHCCMHGNAWDQGMGVLLVSRENANGNVAFAIFLLDLFCLGVKDVSCGVISRGEYNARVYPVAFRGGPIAKQTPEYARKLVESVVAYADYLGLRPHPDYAKARHIFGEVRAEDYPEEFTFGKEGKPLFIAGPRDSAERCRRIMAALRDSVGQGNFHFTMPVEVAGGVFGGIDADDGIGQLPGTQALITSEPEKSGEDDEPDEA